MVQNAGAPQPPQSLSGKVLRPFYYQGKVLEKDKSYDLPRVFALEMKAANKFEIAKDQEPALAPQAEKVEEPKGKKGAKDAG